MMHHCDFENPAQYDALSDDQKRLLQDWIADRIKPARAYCYKRSSYGLKHDLQRETGLYVSNGAFKGAMLAAGYKAWPVHEMNPSYKIRPPRDESKEKGRGWWAKEHGFHVVYDSARGVSITRAESGAIPPP
jgi:hypothetical protein